jgi:hypothetical protein
VLRDEGLQSIPPVLIAVSQNEGRQQLIFEGFPGTVLMQFAVAADEFQGRIDGMRLDEVDLKDLGCGVEVPWRREWGEYKPEEGAALASLSRAVSRKHGPLARGPLTTPIRCGSFSVYQFVEDGVEWTAITGNPFSGEHRLTDYAKATFCPVYHRDPIGHEWFEAQVRGGEVPCEVREIGELRRAREQELGDFLETGEVREVKRLVCAVIRYGRCRDSVIAVARVLQRAQRLRLPKPRQRAVVRDALVKDTEVDDYERQLGEAAPAFFREIVGDRVAQLARTVLPEHPGWREQWVALVRRKYGPDRYRVAVERLYEETLHPGATLDDKELADRCEFSLRRLHAVFGEERNDRSLQRVEAELGNGRGEWAGDVQTLRGELRGPRFDIACELILNFLRGEGEQFHPEISRRTGVPRQTVDRHIRAVWEHVAELLGRWREAG